MALVALATISAIISSAAINSTTVSRRFSALDRLVQEDAIVQAVFARLQAAMGDPDDDLETRAITSRSASVSVGSTTAGVAIEPEDGKIDVLKSDIELVRRYAQNAGLAPGRTAELLSNITTARTARSAADAIEAIRLALLASIPERELERDFTTFGTQGQIDPAYATERVLAAIPDLGPGDLARLIAAPPDQRRDLASSAYFGSGGRRFSVVTTIAWGAAEQSERRLAVELSSAGRLIYVTAAN